MRRQINHFLVGLFLLSQSLIQTSGGTYWNGLITYDPPIQMWGGDQAGNEGVPMTGVELRHEGAADGYAQVNFQLSSINTLFVREEPKEAITTIADLKNFTDSQPSNKTNASTSIINFDGRQALAMTQTNQNSKIGKYSYSITFFWKENRVWLRSSLFSIWVNAEKPENFQKLTASLQTFKINTNLLAPKFAKDEMQLGMSSDEAHRLCGRPFERSGGDEYYISARYLIEVQFQGSQFQINDSASFISYTRLRDSEKFLENPSREALNAQIQPFDEAALDETLKQQTSGGKLKWTSIAINRWKRSDGAMAALTSHALIITTAENWPNVRLPE